jgi:hypothetical protein
VVAVEAIPKAYASHLTGFADDKILIEVQIFGTTTGDVSIDFKPFIYPVAICRGCLSMCFGDLKDGETTADFYGTGCVDNSAQDGRFCVDKGC